MAIRRLNFTKRRKLTRDQVQISLSPLEAGVPRTFEARLELPKDLPSDALVVIEAHRANPFARMRFEWGTVGALRPASDRRLKEFPDDLPPPVFRVKVTSVQRGDGRLLADAQRLRPVDPDGMPESRRGILPIGWQDNDGVPWRLDIDPTSGPRLYIDAIADPDHELPHRTYFRALVFPEVMRQVLKFILSDQDSLDEPDTWQQSWLSLPSRSFGFTEPSPRSSDPEEIDYWVDMAVRWCSRRAGFCRAIAPQAGDA